MEDPRRQAIERLPRLGAALGAGEWQRYLDAERERMGREGWKAGALLAPEGPLAGVS